MSDKSNQTGRLSYIRKIGYGVGDAGSNFCWTFIATFLMIYCTNTLELSAAIVGTLLMISKVLDAITDVFMGRIIDATHSKMGKARFWYFISVLPVALFTFLLFNVPTSFSENTQYIYLFIVYTLVGAVFYTMNNIAYSALTALCTKNAKDRVEMGSYRYIFAIFATLVIGICTSKLVEQFGGGQQGWRAVSLLYTVACLILLYIPVIAVKELPEEREVNGGKTSSNVKKELSIGKSFVILLKNKYFLLILAYYLILFLSSGITSGMGVYFATYQLGDASLLGALTMASMLPLLVVLPFIPTMTAKLGMRNAAMIGNIVSVIGCIPIIIGGATGNFLLIMIGFVVKAVGTGPLSGAINALIAETDEYIYLTTGNRVTGTIYASSSVGIKVGMGLGIALYGFILERSGFDGMAATQTGYAIGVINWSYLIAAAILPIASLIIFYFMNVEQENKRLRD